jgi:hypothetical protein
VTELNVGWGKRRGESLAKKKRGRERAKFLRATFAPEEF